MPRHNAAPGTNSSLRQEQMLNSGPVPPLLGKGRSGYCSYLLLQATPSTQREQLQKPCRSPGSSPTQLQVEALRIACAVEPITKPLSQKYIQGLFYRATILPPMKLQQTKPFMSALPTKQASHLLLRHLAVQGLDENLPAPSLI